MVVALAAVGGAAGGGMFTTKILSQRHHFYMAFVFFFNESVFWGADGSGRVLGPVVLLDVLLIIPSSCIKTAGLAPQRLYFGLKVRRNGLAAGHGFECGGGGGPGVLGGRWGLLHFFLLALNIVVRKGLTLLLFFFLGVGRVEGI